MERIDPHQTKPDDRDCNPKPSPSYSTCSICPPQPSQCCTLTGRRGYFYRNSSKFFTKLARYSKTWPNGLQQEPPPVPSSSAPPPREELINLVSHPLKGAQLMIGMSDYTIFVKDQAQVFLGGPPLVKMATGEVVDSETLGGAGMHSTKSGLSDTLAPDEFSGILAARRWVRSIRPPLQGGKVGRVVEPKYEVDDLLGIVGTDIRKGVMPMGEIVARIVDASRFEIFKPLYGKNMLCAWAYIHGTSSVTEIVTQSLISRSFNWNHRECPTRHIRSRSQ